jgi:Ca-activated chloride channel family protein
MQLIEPDRLLWLLALPVLMAVLMLTIARASSRLRRFADAAMLARLAPGRSVARQVVRCLLILAAMGCVIVALARPWWGEHSRTIVRTDRDVAFLIDVSRSMLANDLSPNRLERAKLWVDDALGARIGDRVAIVGFSGTTSLACPLTSDVGFARLALRTLDTGTVPLGGTNIGDAIRRTLIDVFQLNPEAPDTTRHRDIVIITDGEDHGSLPVQAAAMAGDLGVRIITIGIGSTEGSHITIIGNDGRPQLIEYDGEPVLSRLDMDTLQRIADATPGGHAIRVETGDIDLADVYRSLARLDASALSTTEESTQVPNERFQWFLFPAIGMLILERFIPATSRRRLEALR